MIVERMANIQALRAVRQIGALAKTNNLFARCPGISQSSRSLLTLSSLSRGINSGTANNANYCLLRKAPKPMVTLNPYRGYSAQGEHTKLWVMEKIVSGALPVLFVAAFMAENPITDGLLAVAAMAHTHWGLEAIIVDYVRPAIVGNFISKVAIGSLYFLTSLTLAGLFALIYNGPGIVGSVKKMWAIGKSEKNV